MHRNQTGRRGRDRRRGCWDSHYGGLRRVVGEVTQTIAIAAKSMFQFQLVSELKRSH